MGEAFVQSGIGVVKLQDVLASKDKAFWTHTEQSMAADMHEERHPGVTVRRPWESEEEHKARVKARSGVSVHQPELGMSRERALLELPRQRAMLSGLGLDHPEYEKIFRATTTYIHQLEDVLGLPRTAYKRGEAPAPDPLVQVPDETKAKLARYVAAPEPIRRASIANGKDPILLQLILDIESLPELQVLAGQRLAQVKAGA